VLTLISYKHVEQKTLKVLVDPRTQMILASQHWENITKDLQKNSNLKIQRIGTICKSK
jgi:hypothetical protein